MSFGEMKQRDTLRCYFFSVKVFFFVFLFVLQYLATNSHHISLNP